jgi:AAHS family 4-hydroxybenzoate transporter-like MFS transporter
MKQSKRGGEMGAKLDIAKIIDGQRLRGFNYNLLFWSFLICFVDGYDFTAPGYAAPSLVHAWGISGMATLAPIFSASLFGILVGAPLLGYIGDRFGRRGALILGAVIFGCFTLVAVFATSVLELVVLRFLAGIGIGGVMPIAIVLNSEFAPRRLRATLVCIMFSGLTVGAGIPGMVAAWLVPIYGWQAIFFVGGALPLVVAVGLFFFIPESVKFLTLHPSRRARLEQTLVRLQPGLVIPPNAELVIADEEQRNFSLRQLFAGRLAILTPLLWTMFIMIGVVLYFVQIWTPILLVQMGVEQAHAALAVTMFQVGGMVGVIAMGISIDRWGSWPLLVAFVLAIPVVMLTGTPNLPEAGLVAALFIAGFLVLGSQNGINVLSAAVYPTSIRGNGVGWGLGIGRIGFILGAQIGSLRAIFTVSELFYLAAAPVIIGAVACVMFTLAFKSERQSSQMLPTQATHG